MVITLNHIRQCIHNQIECYNNINISPESHPPKKEWYQSNAGNSLVCDWTEQKVERHKLAI